MPMKKNEIKEEEKQVQVVTFEELINYKIDQLTKKVDELIELAQS